MTMDKQEFLGSSGIPVRTLEVWLEQRWLIPAETQAGPAFSEADIARARLIEELKTDFSVNDEGVDIVLHLMDQLHGLRQVLAQLREEMRRRAPPV
jgi:chaperone modulatory protein CbpM